MPPKSKENERLGLIRTNNQGCNMKIVSYKNRHNIVIEFMDEYKTQINTRWQLFLEGKITNPYYPQIYNKGIPGNKYPTLNEEHKLCKEYSSWLNILTRCFDDKVKEKRPTYQDTTICDEWLLYENFYEWLHSQENFEQWVNLKKSAVDKDILFKGNKIYSPETCCLVPIEINNLFIKSDAVRGDFPIGVILHQNKFVAECSHKINGKKKNYLSIHNTPEEAFYAYKNFKEKLIKRIAQEEYDKGNITKRCYNAIMNYQVEITD